MKKKGIRILAVAMSVMMLCGLLSPFAVDAQTDSAYVKGLQLFWDQGNHARLVDCPEAVYMEYADLLRTDTTAVVMAYILGFIYEGTEAAHKVEPTKERYKEVLLNIIRTYEAENSEALTQQYLLDDTKSLEDYLYDIADVGLQWATVASKDLKLNKGDAVEPEDISLAVSVINQLPKESGEWLKGAAALRATLNLFEKHDTFLCTIEKHADGNLKKAANELRADQTRVVRAHMRAYEELGSDTLYRYGELFIGGIWLDEKIESVISKLPLTFGKLSMDKAWGRAVLGVEFGKIAGNLLAGAEDIMNYLLEIKGARDISVCLEKELNGIMDTLQKDSSKITEADARNYIECGNYLISSRIRGQYCMTAMYLHPSLRMWYTGEEVAESLYNRMAENLLSMKKNLSAICSGIGLAPILSGIQADFIQYYHSDFYGDFTVIAKDGKYGMIGYDGELLLPMEYDLIAQFRGDFRGLPYAMIGEIYYEIDMTGGTPEVYQSEGWPGGDMSLVAYWYENEPVFLLPGDGILDLGLEEGMVGVEIEQNSWQINAVLPVQKISGMKEDDWGEIPIIKNKDYALMDTKTGKLVSDFIYSGFDTGNGFQEGLLAVKKGEKWGFVDEKGNEVTEFVYDAYEENKDFEMEHRYSIYTATNGYIAVLKDGKWGLIDTQGNVVVDTAYDGISQVNPDGMFWLQENGTWSLYQLAE